jgi:Dickkopf N-terminal cysteine-rich region
MRRLAAFVPSLIIVLLAGCPSGSVAKKSPATAKNLRLQHQRAGRGIGCRLRVWRCVVQGRPVLRVRRHGRVPCEPAVAWAGACHLGLPKQCPQDEYCDATDVTTASKCKELPGDRQPCTAQKLCAGGAVCVDDGSGSLVCRAISPNGGACSADQACRSGSCMGAVCVPPPACM